VIFDEFKRNILLNLSDLEIDLLRKLKEHHPNTLFHNIIVAKDTFCVAKNLNLDIDKCISLGLAGLFHDIGKLDIHNLVLDLSSKDVDKIWLIAHNAVVLPKTMVTIKDITLK